MVDGGPIPRTVNCVTGEYQPRHGSTPVLKDSTGGHRDDLQGLRGVAVLLVLLGHASVPFLPGGFIGVDVFFVLSGFLITAVLLRDYATNGRIHFGVFYARRVRRLLPTAALVLVVTTIAGVAILGVDASRDLVVSAAWTAVFLGNVHLIANGNDYFASDSLPSPFQQYWSLAVEEQFYLVWPVLLLLGLAVGKRLFTPRVGALAVVSLATVASFAWALRQTGDDPAAAYYSTFTRAWELGVGALLALAVPYLPDLTRRAAGITQLAGLSLIGLGAVGISAQTPYPGVAALLPVGGAALIIAAGVSTLPRPDALANPVLTHLGDISYAAYLWHWPLLVLPIYITGETPSLGVSLLLVLVALGLAEVTTRFFENPVRFSASLVASKPLTFALAVALLVGPVVVMSPLLSIPAPGANTYTASQSAEVVQQVSRGTAGVASAVPITDRTRPLLNQLTRDAGAHVDQNCMSSTSSVDVLTCTFGDAAGSRHVIVFGDSHAGMWTPGLDKWGQQAGVRVTLMAKTSCSPWMLSIWHRRIQKPHVTCDPWREAALTSIVHSDADLVLVAGNVNGVNLHVDGQQVSDPRLVSSYWREGATSTLALLTSSGKRVAVLADVPAFAQDTLTCLATNREDTRECGQVADPATYLQRLDIEQEAAAETGAGFIMTYDWFCTKGTCPVVVNDMIVYRDNGGHITATYAAWLSNALGERIAPHLPAASEPA